MPTTKETLRLIAKTRRVYLRGQITEASALRLITEIGNLAQESEKPIRLDINSTGGSLEAAFKIYTAIKRSRAPLYGVVTKAHSGALYVLQACTRRIGKAKSKYGLHYNSIRVPIIIEPYTDTSDLKKYIDEKIKPRMQRQWLKISHVLLPRLMEKGKTEEDLKKLLLPREYRFSAKEALEWGFIDEIVRI
jgi:ATP-dependent protease ClpP protease subunit